MTCPVGKLVGPMGGPTGPTDPQSNNQPAIYHDIQNSEEFYRSQLEDKLEQLLQSLLEVGICTSDVQENAREGGRTGRGEPLGPGGLIGKKINESIGHMTELYELNSKINCDIPIPIEVISSVDQGTNPDRWLKSFVERAAHENMYTNGIISNINQYHSVLKSSLSNQFPELYSSIYLAEPLSNNQKSNINNENNATNNTATKTDLSEDSFSMPQNNPHQK
ncbi:transcription factor subunit Med10 of mediator complex-domain-containing protein [Phakopsora pachyrhizi]|nr:transcription factor subunit Med10 of mediator complex-domain-containing protein [Phakopsora pachyrhizi]